MFIIAVMYFGYNYVNARPPATANLDSTGNNEAEEEEEPSPPRNFTRKQLAYFDGKMEDKSEDHKPVYLSVNGIVFDVSDGRNFYGPGGPYEAFAGHECGVALAKMSFDTEHLDDLDGCERLNFGEKQELDNWIEKFQYYRCYPIKGRLISDSELATLASRTLTKDDLAKHTGSPDEPVLDGYAARSIYIAAGSKVFDMSFGGIEFYGPGCSYNRFAGKDASRALAKMSFEDADLSNTDTSDLDDKQKKVLDDWIKTFEVRKGYPIVGTIEK